MAKQAKTLLLIEQAYEILADQNPMTVRQLYYQLVSRQAIDNNKGQYSRLTNIIVQARKSGAIPWEWIEDRLRRPRSVSMWDNLAEFADTVRNAYRRDVWETQPQYIECWLEKDALSGIFEDILGDYGVTLNVGRGYDGRDSIRNAALRFERAAKPITVLYYGDFDPSGEDMVRSLRERLQWFGCEPEIIKCALNKKDITDYNLPPDPTKTTDTRAAKFKAKHGDNCVELDALPVGVLRERIQAETEIRMDMAALRSIQRIEDQEREVLVETLSNL